MTASKKQSRTFDLLILAGICFVVGGFCIIVGRADLHRADEIREGVSLQRQDGGELKRLVTQGSYYEGIGTISLCLACVLGIAGIAVVAYSKSR
jgi:hypothetical protein